MSIGLSTIAVYAFLSLSLSTSSIKAKSSFHTGTRSLPPRLRYRHDSSLLKSHTRKQGEGLPVSNNADSGMGVDADAEVVGSSGRIGSFLLRSLSLQLQEQQKERNEETTSRGKGTSTDINNNAIFITERKMLVANVPRNEATGPGSYSSRGRPIFVSVPATQISNGTCGW